MARKSKLASLPQEIQQEIHALLRDGRTIDQIVQALKDFGLQQGEDFSRSGVGRLAFNLRKVAERAARAQQLAEAFAGQASGEKASTIIQGSVNALGGLFLDIMEKAEEGENLTLEASDVRDFGRGLESIAKASKLAIDTKSAELKFETENKELTSGQGENTGAGGVIEIRIVEHDPEKARTKANKQKRKKQEKPESTDQEQQTY